MDRQFWRETRRSALVLLLLFFTSGTMLVVGKAGSNEYGTDPLSISVLIANRLAQTTYYQQHDAEAYSPDDLELLQEYVRQFAQEGTFLSLILYEEDVDHIRAVSGNYLSLWSMDSNFPTVDAQLYVALDDAAEKERAALTQALHQGRLVSVTGYRKGNVVYPTQIVWKMYQNKMNWKTLKKENVADTKTIAFSLPDQLEQAEQIVLNGDLRFEFVGNQDSYAVQNESGGKQRHIMRAFREAARMARSEDQKYRTGKLTDFAVNGFSWSNNAVKNAYSLLSCVRPAENGGPALYLSVNLVNYPLYDALSDYGVYLAVLFFFYLCIFIALLTRKFQAVYLTQSRASQRQRDFTNALAHEMKTPLGVIRGYSELMQEGIAPEKHPAYLAGIVGETERMDAMVLQILSFSRIDTRHLPVRPVCFAIDALICEQLADFQPGIEKKQLTLYLEVPEFLYVTADAKGMALGLRNLISNAVKYALPGKAVKLRAFSEKRRVVVEVFNEGPPVAERDLPYLWDAFYRAEESRTRENGGSGMGLAIVKAVLDQHRARYGVYNKSGGVYFWFSLPS